MKETPSGESLTPVTAESVLIAERAEALWFLYEISKVLTQFEGVSQTVPQIIEVIGRALPLRSVTFLLQTEDGQRPLEIVWSAAGVSDGQLRAANRHANSLYRYLVGGSTADETDLGVEAVSDDGWQPTNIINLPLVVAHRPIVGALHLDGLRPFEEPDLIFINAAVNQLAIAIHRQDVLDRMSAATEAERERAVRAERRQTFLASASAALASSIEYRETVLQVGQLAVPEIANLFFLDEADPDGGCERLVAVFDAEPAPATRNDPAAASPPATRTTPQARVIKTGQAIVLCEFPGWMDTIAYDTEHAATMRAAGVKTMLVVPILARGVVLGALTLATAAADPHYSSTTLSVAEDLANRIAMAMENARLYHQAQRAVLARENVLAIVSHDLRSPLSAILLNLSSMQRDASISEKGKVKLGIMKRSAERMIRMIQDLLDMVSIDAHQLSIRKLRVPTAGLLNDVLEEVRWLAESNEIALTLDAAPLLPSILADAPRIHQVLVNLIGNAVKFTRPGGTIQVQVEPLKDVVQFSVTDDGQGIAEHDLPKIFERMWQVPQNASMGTGLGLFIVRGIVEAHGGHIRAISQLGAGSTFRFTIPTAPR
jgi:signal transduction histidine kinase